MSIYDEGKLKVFAVYNFKNKNIYIYLSPLKCILNYNTYMYKFKWAVKVTAFIKLIYKHILYV